MHMSVDGFISGKDGALDWPVMDPEVSQYMVPELLKTVDSMILGRVLYEGFSNAWPAMAANPNSPKEIVDFAHWIEDSPKIVISDSEAKLEWKNTRQIVIKNDEEMIDAIQKLKQEPGKDIVLFGGARIAQTLAKLNLIDEYRFKVEPVVVGSGSRLFENVKDRIKLKLIKSKEFACGVMGIYYQPIK